MMRRLTISFIFSVVLIFGASAMPASALTIADLQAQIQQLMARIAELTRAQNEQNQNVTPLRPVQIGGQPIAQHRVCTALYRSLSQGTSGNDVVALQEFLHDRGHFTANATGYYGPLTASAVARWQSAEGIQSVGIVGPLTRERIKHWCGSGTDAESDDPSIRFSAAPQRGTAPLAVTFTTNVQLADPQFIADAGDYKVVFGDGSEYTLPCSSRDGFCSGPHRAQHTYGKEGTYTASLVHFGYFGIPGPNGLPENTIGTATIYVGDDIIACTKEYAPVCGERQVQCITTPCDPVQQTYSNRCMMRADDATFVHEGRCHDMSTNPERDPRCAQWYDGCNNCSRETPNGLAICTLRACIQQAPAYCTAYFDDDDTTPTACTADAKQCPDGSWVGRSGPNCEFKCPTYSGLYTCLNDPLCQCDASGRTVLCQ